MNRRTAGWLLTIGLALVALGGILWAVENGRVHRHNNGVSAEAAGMSEAISGSDLTGFTPATANHTPSIVLFVAGGIGALFGMLVLSQNGPPPAPIERGPTHDD